MLTKKKIKIENKNFEKERPTAQKKRRRPAIAGVAVRAVAMSSASLAFFRRRYHYDVSQPENPVKLVEILEKKISKSAVNVHVPQNSVQLGKT